MENSFYELASKRRSIRKFTDKKVAAEDIEYFISCATNAPSGCNSQCWHFVAVQDKELIEKTADEAGKYARAFYGSENSLATEEFLNAREKAVSFFRNAPLVIFVLLDRLDYYDKRVTQVFTEKGYSYRESLDIMAYPDILSIGAAIQNLLLAVTERGYGACWMNDPSIAGEKLVPLITDRQDLKLISVIPVGEPMYTPREKKLKELSDVLECK